MKTKTNRITRILLSFIKEKIEMESVDVIIGTKTLFGQKYLTNKGRMPFGGYECDCDSCTEANDIYSKFVKENNINLLKEKKKVLPNSVAFKTMCSTKDSLQLVLDADMFESGNAVIYIAGEKSEDNADVNGFSFVVGNGRLLKMLLENAMEKDPMFKSLVMTCANESAKNDLIKMFK